MIILVKELDGCGNFKTILVFRERAFYKDMWKYLNLNVTLVTKNLIFLINKRLWLFFLTNHS